MAKVAKLVYFSLAVRVIVDENATQDEIIQTSKLKVQALLDNRELGENLDCVVDDEDCPATEEEIMWIEANEFIKDELQDRKNNI